MRANINYVYFDTGYVEETIYSSQDTLMKTYSNLADSYIKEIAMVITDKDCEVSIWIDDIEVFRVDINDFRSFFDMDTINLDMVSIDKKGGNFSLAVKFDDNYIKDHMKIFFKRTRNGSESIELQNVYISFKKEREIT